MAVTQDPEAWARLGGKIRDSREAQGFSRKKLSELAGVSEKSIQVAEEGRVPRARWPQSLTVIEAALGWAEGSMRNILEGGEAHLAPPLFDREQVPMFGAYLSDEPDEPGATEPDAVLTGSPVDLPPEIQDALAHVMRFGSNCVANGAPEWLGTAYDNTVAALLRSLYEQIASSRPGYQDPAARARQRPVRPHPPYSGPSLSEVMRASARNAPSLADVARMYPSLSLTQSARQINALKAAQRAQAQQAVGPTMRRMSEAIAQQNKEAAERLAQLAGASRQAAIADMERRLEELRQSSASAAPQESEDENSGATDSDGTDLP